MAVDQHARLRTLDRRHDDVVRQLDDLNHRVEQVLASVGQASSSTGRSPSQLPSSTLIEVPGLIDGP